MFKKDLIANYLGQAWTALLMIGMVPFYIKYLGIESYGLIGVFGVLQIWFSLLDMGMTPTLNREMAILQANPNNLKDAINLLRSFEYIFLGISFFVFIIIFLSSDWISKKWLNSNGLSIKDVSQSLVLMGGIICLRFYESIYKSSLIGLKKQVLFNFLNFFLVNIRWIGAAGVLIWISPTLKAFFLWQIFVSVITFFTLLKATYISLPSSLKEGRFSTQILKKTGKFTSAMSILSVLTIILTQVDKILLSKLLSLTDYGYYTMSVLIASSLSLLAGPIITTIYPVLCELYAKNDLEHLRDRFHKFAQLITISMGSLAFLLIFFCDKILLIWSQDIVIVNHCLILVRLLSIGNLLNGLMWIPYQTQLAYGQTRLSIKINCISVIVIIPAIFIIAPIYGAIGVAYTWILLNTGYILISAQFIFNNILHEEKTAWYLNDLCIPLITSILVIGTSYLLEPEGQNQLFQFFWILITFIISLTICSLSSSKIRPTLLYLVKTYINKKQ